MALLVLHDQPVKKDSSNNIEDTFSMLSHIQLTYDLTA